jgi:hypothetical protein
MTTSVRIDIQQTPSQSQAQQMAASELANPKYHAQPTPQNSVTVLPSIGAPTTTPAPPPPSTTTSSSSTVILVIIGAIVLVLILVLVLRAIGKPKKDKDKKPKKKKKDKSSGLGGQEEAPAFDEVLVGAALHRRNAQTAAEAGQWAEAIRQRFRAVISTLDELALLPERPERTADEAARDAGDVLPEHRLPLSAAARAFDEVEYGEYLGSAAGYEQIRAVDEQIAARASAGRPAVRR